MTHPLVEQLRFTRGELKRALAGITDDDARTRFGAINSMSWIICHLAGQERRYWLIRAQGVTDLVPVLDEWGGYGKPANTPPLADAWEAYDAAIAAVDPYLDGLTDEAMLGFYTIDGQQHDESVGTMLLRVIYHNWFHIGEAYAIRQMLGHANLPEFVGDIGAEAPYRPR